jgi:hypothetical protein
MKSSPSPRAARPHFSVKNWEKMQHYSPESRSTIWIKLYASLLDDVDGILDLPETLQAHLVKLWLLALRQKNKIPVRLAWIEGEIGAQSTVDFARLLREGWISAHNIADHDLEAILDEPRPRPMLADERAVTNALKAGHLGPRGTDAV